jgi:hypothetical protein
MASRESLYRVSVSSSGLIYAVIVGAWAAYLVPMWLRRQDELNEARPTERFSTAIRLLSGRAGLERRYAKGLGERDSEHRKGGDVPDDPSAPVAPGQGGMAPDPEPLPADEPPSTRTDSPVPHPPAARRERPLTASAADRARRSKALARRRRTTLVLFLAFTLGSVAAAVGGLRLLWAPGIPAVLLSVYIAYLRTQERRRYAVRMDQRGAQAAAQRLRERQRARTSASAEPPSRGAPANGTDQAAAPGTLPAPASPHTAGRRALIEQTDHAEWVDQQREPGPAQGASWDPVPVPLPTYVTAPVAPRASGNVDLDAADAWSSARSGKAEPADDPDPSVRRPPGRRARERGSTPLFDQYAEEDRPRAANE